MSKIKKLILVVFLILLLLTIEVVIVKSASQYEPKINVVYAKTDIAAKALITKDMLTTKTISLSMVHLKAYRSVDELVGKTAKADIVSGEMILSGRIGKLDEMTEIRVLDKNNRLFAVEFKPDQANGWWLLIDQKVDLIFIPTSAGGVNVPLDISKPTNPDTITATMPTGTELAQTGVKRLENIRVAAIIDEGLKQLNNETRTSNPKFISFEVTKEQDEFLAWAKGNGRIEISVRPNK